MYCLLSSQATKASHLSRWVLLSHPCLNLVISIQCHHQCISQHRSSTWSVANVRIRTNWVSHHSFVHQCRHYLVWSVHNSTRITVMHRIISIHVARSHSRVLVCLQGILSILEHQDNIQASCPAATVHTHSSCSNICNTNLRGINAIGKTLIRWGTSCKNSKRTQLGARKLTRE